MSRHSMGFYAQVFKDFKKNALKKLISTSVPFLLYVFFSALFAFLTLSTVYSADFKDLQKPKND